MSMFDWVQCRYPLPANLPPGDAFQTKDLTNALLHYRITEEGRLEEGSGAEDRSAFTGTIHLVWSNVVASGPGLYTADGEDAHFLEYAVTFVDGLVRTAQEIENRQEPALAFSQFPRWKTPSEDELRAEREREQERLTGRTLWLWWGGRETGYAVTVVAENSRELVVQAQDQHFEIVHRGSRDRTLFDSYEDGRRFKEERKAEWERERTAYQDALRARAEKVQEKPPDGTRELPC